MNMKAKHVAGDMTDMAFADYVMWWSAVIEFIKANTQKTGA